MTCLGVAAIAWVLVMTLLPMDTFNKEPEPSRSATPAVTVGEWGSTSSFPHFTIMLQAPVDASSQYGCPNGPCPIIEVPAFIVSRGAPLSLLSLQVFATDAAGGRLPVVGVGSDVLQAGASYANVWQVWTSSQHMKDGLTIAVTSDGGTVEWHQANRP